MLLFRVGENVDYAYSNRVRQLFRILTETRLKRAHVPIAMNTADPAPFDKKSKSTLYESILIPTDGSNALPPAIRHGVSLAHAYAATVHVLRIVEDVSHLGGTAVFSPSERNTWEEAAAIEPVMDAAHTLGLNVIPSIGHGSPPDVILNYIEENNIDLMVLGTHGRTGLARYLHGSTSEQLVRNAPVPVLTVKEDRSTFPDWQSFGDQTRYTEILVPTDGCDEASVALEHGVEIASQYDATLHGLFVVDHRTYTSRPGFTWQEAKESWEQRGRRVLMQVAEKAETVNLDVRITLTHGNPRKEILEYATENDIDFIAMGTRGLTGVSRFLQGSVATGVVRAADVPVLTTNSTAVQLKQYPVHSPRSASSITE